MSAALQKKNVVRFRHAQELTQEIARLANDLRKHGAAVTHLHQTHPATVIIGKLLGDFFENRNRQHAWTCRKVIYAIHFFVRGLRTPKENTRSLS